MDIDIVLKYSDEEFIEFISKRDDFVTNSKIVNKILNLNPSALNSFLTVATKPCISHIIEQEAELMESSIMTFRIFYTRIDNINKKHILDNDNLLRKLVSIPKNSLGKTLVDISDMDLVTDILRKKHILDEINSDLYFEILKSLPDSEFEYIISSINPTGFISNGENLDNYLEGKYNSKEKNIEIHQLAMTKFLTDLKSTHYLLRIKSYEQLFIYIKFGLYIDFEMQNSLMVFKDNTTIPFSVIENLNRKHITTLIEEYYEMDRTGEKHQIFINSVKMYILFGFDGAKKIANGFFSNMTDKSINRVAEAHSVEKRKNCRIKNERDFYSNELKKLFQLALVNNDKDFILNCLEISHEEYDLVVEKFSKEDDLEALLKQYISARERKIHFNNVEEYIKKNNSKFKNITALTNEKIYKTFLNVATSKFILNNKGISEPDTEFIKFLLGDLKKDNDALLRILFNDSAFGLERSIDNLINKFRIIKQICDDSKGKITLYSIMNLMDISKTLIYQLKPNEKDIPFNDLVNLVNDSNFIKDSQNEVLRKALKLHKDRRNKIYSSIPLVCGTFDDISYKTIEFDDPSLITIGVNNGSCFRVGAIGEEFLEYSIKSPHSAIIELRDHMDNRYTCPIVRNGNGVYGNGIDPKIPNELTRRTLMSALKVIGKKIIDDSQEQEKIEFFAISNLNQMNELPNDNYYELDMANYEQIEDFFHADYLMKKDEKNHNDRRRVFAIASCGFIKPVYYLPKSKFYQERSAIHTFDETHDLEVKKIEFLINSINYSIIDYKMISESEKESLRANFSEINPHDFAHIQCSKDWFVALDHNSGLISERLDYDDRSLIEYKQALEFAASKMKGKVR